MLSKTDAGGADAGPSDAAPDATADARPCTGGTARATDPTSGACFVFFNQNRNHTDAEASCVALAMHLATIRSASENTTADSLIGGNDVFIGLNDIVAEGQYRWPDGSAPVFTNYRSGEPNNGGGGGSEDCTLLEGSRGGTWDDRACVSQVPYICSFE
ncbi:MAG TPA: C-type lectin domain-containing protein [Kofleriaceae bacterium]|nr:C-type lectin domain-containing protein [Kofleriaceae bacterium]